MRYTYTNAGDELSGTGPGARERRDTLGKNVIVFLFSRFRTGIYTGIYSVLPRRFGYDGGGGGGGIIFYPAETFEEKYYYYYYYFNNVSPGRLKRTHHTLARARATINRLNYIIIVVVLMKYIRYRYTCRITVAQLQQTPAGRR